MHLSNRIQKGISVKGVVYCDEIFSQSLLKLTNFLKKKEKLKTQKSVKSGYEKSILPKKMQKKIFRIFFYPLYPFYDALGQDR